MFAVIEDEKSVGVKRGQEDDNSEFSFSRPVVIDECFSGLCAGKSWLAKKEQLVLATQDSLS